MKTGRDGEKKGGKKENILFESSKSSQKAQMSERQKHTLKATFKMFYDSI